MPFGNVADEGIKVPLVGVTCDGDLHRIVVPVLVTVLRSHHRAACRMQVGDKLGEHGFGGVDLQIAHRHGSQLVLRIARHGCQGRVRLNQSPAGTNHTKAIKRGFNDPGVALLCEVALRHVFRYRHETLQRALAVEHGRDHAAHQEGLAFGTHDGHQAGPGLTLLQPQTHGTGKLWIRCHGRCKEAETALRGPFVLRQVSQRGTVAPHHLAQSVTDDHRCGSGLKGKCLRAQSGVGRLQVLGLGRQGLVRTPHGHHQQPPVHQPVCGDLEQVAQHVLHIVAQGVLGQKHLTTCQQAGSPEQHGPRFTGGRMIGRARQTPQPPSRQQQHDGDDPLRSNLRRRESAARHKEERERLFVCDDDPSHQRGKTTAAQKPR